MVYRPTADDENLGPDMFRYRNKSWKPECVLSFNMGWRILVFIQSQRRVIKFTNIRQPMLKRKTHSHAPVHVTDFPVANVHVDELSSARIWQHKLCATLSANVNINYRLPVKVYYRICTLRHIRIEIINNKLTDGPQYNQPQ
jgi:hypothetical protein